MGVDRGDEKEMTVGSLMDDLPLPDWLERGVESSLRDSAYDVPSVVPVVVPVDVPSRAIVESGGGRDLDAFYEELSESESESESESTIAKFLTNYLGKNFLDSQTQLKSVVINYEFR